MSYHIVSWNVNSLRVRLPQVLELLTTKKIDILALQECKCVDDEFPVASFTELGYEVCFTGQKTYNGVAIVTKKACTDICYDPPEWPYSSERRVLAATIDNLRIINLYVPNGAALTADKFTYKLAWLATIKKFLAMELAKYPSTVVLGDFNIAPKAEDVYNPEICIQDILFSPQEQQALQEIMDLGFFDSFRLFEQPEKQYSWWDYRTNAFKRNIGFRIDLILASKSLASRITAAGIYRATREHERPSDHAPVFIQLDASI